jgi:hypothetical protein
MDEIDQKKPIPLSSVARHHAAAEDGDIPRRRLKRRKFQP